MTPMLPSGRSISDPERYRRLLHRIGTALLDVAPAGWRRVDLRCAMTVGVQDLTLTVVGADGADGAVPVEPPVDVGPAFADLRRLMWQPDLGTWFAARYLIGSSGDHHVSWNFDHDPHWRPPLPPAEFLRDVRTFPRAAAHVPVWLRALLLAAEQEEVNR